MWKTRRLLFFDSTEPQSSRTENGRITTAFASSLDSFSLFFFFLSQRRCLANPAADRFHPAASSLMLLSCLSLDPPAQGSSRLLTCVETHQPLRATSPPPATSTQSVTNQFKVSGRVSERAPHRYGTESLRHHIQAAPLKPPFFPFLFFSFSCSAFQSSHLPAWKFTLLVWWRCCAFFWVFFFSVLFLLNITDPERERE